MLLFQFLYLSCRSNCKYFMHLSKSVWLVAHAGRRKAERLPLDVPWAV